MRANKSLTDKSAPFSFFGVISLIRLSIAVTGSYCGSETLFVFRRFILGGKILILPLFVSPLEKQIID